LESWIKFQYLKSLEEDSLSYINSRLDYFKEKKERYKKNKDEEYEGYIKHDEEIAKSWNERRIAVSHEISKMQAEVINKNFNPHLSDYGKVLDENGEPLMVWRGTDYAPNEQGHFEIPVVPYGKSDDVKIGTFFGKKKEALVHHNARTQEGKSPFLYSCFVNVKNIKILSRKFDWWSEKDRMKNIQGKYDGIIVKEDEGELFKDGRINLMDLIVFSPKNVLINKAERNL
jgi:hypothetical protein